MSEARNAGVLERGLLIGGKSVSASSGKLADDISPWDGEIYARVAAGTPADITPWGAAEQPDVRRPTRRSRPRHLR
jgi:acyl-CoA reductase-like NAD-dependent aldehyde dehydrogenase